jgi:predicted component of type VI protein secretion system
MAMLIGMSESYRGQTFELNEDKVSIGRSTNNILSFEHGTVSSRHCAISRKNKQFTLTDLGSTNGTRVNGRDITESVLRPKDLIQIGSLEFMFDAEESEIEAAPSHSNTQVEIAVGPTAAPVSFSSISPFGTRRQTRLVWYVLIALIGAAALAAVVFFFIKLAASG